jgi:hypothetical protein
MKMEHDIPKPMGFSTSHMKRKDDSSKCYIKKLERVQINNLMMLLEETEKQK